MTLNSVLLIQSQQKVMSNHASKLPKQNHTDEQKKKRSTANSEKNITDCGYFPSQQPYVENATQIHIEE